MYRRCYNKLRKKLLRLNNEIIEDINACCEKSCEKSKLILSFKVIKNQRFSVKKCNNFSKTATIKYIIPILI